MKKMMFLLMMICLSANSWAQSGNCGKVNATDVTWALNTKSNTLTISGTGAMADFTENSPAPWYDYSGNITSVVIKSGVTGIGNYAFKGCSVLTTVSIPGSVTSIGNGVFRSCLSLTSVSIPDGVTSIGDEAFTDCRALATVNIPNSVTSIGLRAFQSCSGLTTVSIPNSVTSIKGQAFQNCLGLKSVNIPANIISIGDNAFDGCSDLTDVYYASTSPTAYNSNWNLGSTANPARTLHIPSGTTTAFSGKGWTAQTVFASIKEDIPIRTCGAQGSDVSWILFNNTLTISGTGAMADYTDETAPWYADRSSITSVEIKSGVTSIGNYAFFGCSALTSVSIPVSVKGIGNQAFFGCSGLTSVSIPDNVTSIGAYAFKGCSGLTSVSIPSSVNDIGESAFDSCSGLTTITVDANNATYKSKYIANRPINAILSKDKKTLLVGCKTTTIPSDVTSIGNSAFSGCSGLTTISIPGSVTRIEASAFAGCSGLTTISIPGSVTRIEASAFAGCSGLTTITADANNTAYKSTDANGNPCNALLSKDGKTLILGCKNTTIPSGVTNIEKNAFENCSSLTSISIPSSVTSIGSNAFVNCSALTDVYYATTTPITYSAYWQLGSTANPARTLHIPSGTTTAFSGKGWTAQNVFASIKEDIPIGTCGAQGSDVSWILFNNTLTISGTGAMADYTVGTTPWYAYRSSITSVVIGSGVTGIGNYAFRDCSDLTTITVDANNATFRSTGRDDNQCNAILSKDGKTLIAGYRTTTIPNGVTSIGNDAFNGCSGLTSVSIPYSVISIGDNAFNDCSALTDVYYVKNTPITYSANWKLGSTTNPARTLHIPSGTTTAFSGKGWTAQNVFASIKEDIPIGTCGAQGSDVSWILFNNTLTISGTGDMADYDYRTTPWYADYSSITSVVIESGVTSIGAYAFYDCSGLTTVSIPDGVTRIGNDAFNDCSGLTSVSIPNSVTSIGNDAFNNCSGLTSVSIPNSVTSIGAYAFYDCSGLTSVSIPNSVTSIGVYAFNDCSGLATIIVESGNDATYRSTDGNNNECNAILSKDGKKLIVGCKTTTIPSDVTSIGNYAFSGCSGLTSVSIPNSVTSIEYEAFSGCSSLTSVSIPGTVTCIPYAAFNGCSGLTSVSIPSSVTSIGNNAFNGCSGLTSVSIPNSVTSIGDAAFSGCSGLTSVSIPSGVTSIGTNAFSGCSGLTSVSIPNSVTSITYRTFFGCSSLTSVSIPNSVTSIGEYAFYHCSALTSVSIPSGVTSIGTNAFNGCSGLTSVSIPGSVTGIGDYAFEGCSALANVYYNTTSPIAYSTNWYLGSTSNPARTLHVPVGATATAFSGWASYFAAVKYDIVDVTVKTGLVYTGSEQTGVQAATGYNTVTDGAKTDAGNYTATASLTSGYAWPDGTTAPKTIAWSIAQATNAWTKQPAMADYAYGTTPSTPAGAASSETPEFSYYTEEACTNAVDLTTDKPAPGTYYMKAATAGTGNYTALSKVVAFHITNQMVTLNESGTDNGLTGKDAVKSNVTYARTFAVGNWSTICLPFALTQSQMDAAFGSSYEVAKLEGVSSGALSFTKVTGDMTAGTPYIIKFSGTAPTTLTFNDVTIDKTGCSFSVGTGETCTMTGTSAVTAITNGANHYIMQGNKIYRVATDNVKMAAFRAYLTYSESNGSPAKADALTFDVDGETTGIAGVGVDSSNVNDAWYTLGGQKLSKKPTANGIYISNGRKIVIK